MPRPARISPLPTRVGDGRVSHLNASAAALMQAIDRAFLNPLSSALALIIFKRNCTGSAFAAAASSSMNDSDANVDCGPFGSRRFPVRTGVSNTVGKLTTCVVMRRFGIAYISLGTAELPRLGDEGRTPINCACLLYTSDAADERSSV